MKIFIAVSFFGSALPVFFGFQSKYTRNRAELQVKNTYENAYNRFFSCHPYFPAVFLFGIPEKNNRKPQKVIAQGKLLP